MGADLADMQLISKFNKGYRYLLHVVDIFSKNCIQHANLIKYGLIKEVNFIVVLLKNG